MKKTFNTVSSFFISLSVYADFDGSVGLSFGPSVSFYNIKDDNVFSNDLAIRINGSNDLVKNWKANYTVGFNYPALCLVNGENVGLSLRLTDLTVELGLSYTVPANSKVFMDFGGGLSYFMGAKPLKSGERIYQYVLNMDAYFSTLFKLNPIFGITLDLKVYAPLYIFSYGNDYKKHSSMTGFYAIGSVGFVYLYSF